MDTAEGCELLDNRASLGTFLLKDDATPITNTCGVPHRAAHMHSLLFYVCTTLQNQINHYKIPTA